jgi:hypothetical protein
VDASPGVAATEMVVRTTTPGWSGDVYAATDGPPDDISGWTKVGAIPSAKKSNTIELDTAGVKSRYYLVWITKLPEGEERATISDLALLSKKTG